MANFNETYFYSSVLDDGKLKENGYGIKNVNDSKEYYVYDKNTKDYVSVNKEQYVDYIEKMEQSNEITCPLKEFNKRPIPESVKSIPKPCNHSPVREPCIHSPTSVRQIPVNYYPMGGYVRRVPEVNEVEQLRRENRKLKGLLQYYTNF